MKKLKIAIDVSQMCYEGTGVARYVKELTKSLLELNSPHQFVFYAGTLRERSFFKKISMQSPWDQSGWKIFPLPPKLAGYALTDTSIPFELLTGPVDIIHASDWSQPSSKVPLVTTVHDLVFRKYPETVDPLILNNQTKRLEKIKSDSSQIIADSLSTKKDLVEIYGISKERIKVVYPGLSDHYIKQSNTEIERVKTKYNLPEQYILSVGTQEPRKNISRLQEAVKDLSIPLVVIGKHGWGENTQTLGFVPDSDLPGVYGGAKVFAYPSLYEGFGFPILEAMSCGTPVVTSNTSSMPELAGDAAVLVDPNSTLSIQQGITKALTSSEALSVKGLAQSNKFTWNKTAKAVLEIYETIANRN